MGKGIQDLSSHVAHPILQTIQTMEGELAAYMMTNMIIRTLGLHNVEEEHILWQDPPSEESPHELPICLKSASPHFAPLDTGSVYGTRQHWNLSDC